MRMWCVSYGTNVGNVVTIKEGVLNSCDDMWYIEKWFYVDIILILLMPYSLKGIYLLMRMEGGSYFDLQ